MSKATYPLKLSASIKREAERLTKLDGVSLNQWIGSAVAQKIAAVETAAEFLRMRAAGASGDRLREFLGRAPDREAEPGNELPPGWRDDETRDRGRPETDVDPTRATG